VTDTADDTTEAAPAPAFDYKEMTRVLMAEIREYGHPTTGWPAGQQLLLLTTTGAKSGEARTSAVAYTRDGDAYVVVGSKSGAPTHPAWYFNLLANPTVTVEANLEKFQAHANVAEGAERQRLWDQHVALHVGIGEYPKKTDRVIPVIVLERIAE
jgi:deazaflavin-dependent oxidoreductase (nitroreductase family)